MTIDTRAADDSSMFDPPPRTPSSLLLERMLCTLGECSAHMDGIYQFRHQGLLVCAPLCAACATSVAAGAPALARSDLAAAIDTGMCWCAHREADGARLGMLVEFCPLHGRHDETHNWLYCQECAETGALCERHARQAKED